MRALAAGGGILGSKVDDTVCDDRRRLNVSSEIGGDGRGTGLTRLGEKQFVRVNLERGCSIPQRRLVYLLQYRV